jgi:uncharacterized protein with LGFP repeats
LISPDFDGFAAAHPWIGSKLGERQSTGAGFVQHFQNASVHGVIGGDPHEVRGAILAKFEQLGGPGGVLGFPRTDETATIDGEGRFNHFEHGSIFWHPSIGAFEVHGLIRDTWAGMGWETSFLGYPVSDEFDCDGGRRSDFQNGSILWTAASGVQVQPQAFVVNAPSITFGAGISIGGYGCIFGGTFTTADCPPTIVSPFLWPRMPTAAYIRRATRVGPMGRMSLAAVISIGTIGARTMIYGGTGRRFDLVAPDITKST